MQFILFWDIAVKNYLSIKLKAGEYLSEYIPKKCIL